MRCPNLGWLLRRSSSTPSFQLMSKLCTLTGKRGTGNRDIISARRKMKMPSLTWHAQNIYCSICILRHCSFPDLSLGLAGWKSCDCGWTCDQLTSNTHTAVLFIHYSTALENSIEFYRLKWLIPWSLWTSAEPVRTADAWQFLHSDIMTGTWCKVTGQHLASLRRRHKEDGDTSHLFGRHRMPVANRHTIDAAWQTVGVSVPAERHAGVMIMQVKSDFLWKRFCFNTIH